MEIFPLLYIFLQIIFITFSLLSKKIIKEYFINIIATLNLLLFLNGLYLIRLLIGLIQFFRPILRGSTDMQFSSSIFIEPTLRLAGMVFFPFLFLIPMVRKNSIITLLMCIYIVFNYTPNYISEIDTLLKCFFCISIFAFTYSVLWLFQILPSQSTTK